MSIYVLRSEENTLNQILIEKIRAIAAESEIFLNEPMKRHTSFRIGGPADIFVCPSSMEAIRDICRLCRAEQVPLFILGNGSNLLVSDKGYRGVVLQILKNFNEITIEDNTITACAGAQLSRVAKEAAKQSLTGFEFAAGIPGTIGGAVVMNAGAYGGEMKDVLVWVDVLTPEGDIIRVKKEDLDLSYRHSIIDEKEYVVLKVCLELQKGDLQAINDRMEELRIQRTSKQPLDLPSAGSTFKRPAGHFAGKLIMDAGLRGFRVGDAQVSEKHCGFVVNVGEATAEDVDSLMKQVSQKVMEQFQVELEPEVRKIGEF